MVIMYSTGCPRCTVLKKKLEEKGIVFTINDSEEEMLTLGFTEVPVLNVGGVLMQFAEAIKWVNEQ